MRTGRERDGPLIGTLIQHQSCRGLGEDTLAMKLSPPADASQAQHDAVDMAQ